MSYNPVELNNQQQRMMQIARVAFMTDCPFYAHYFRREMKEVATLDVPGAATDGTHLFYNPEYFATLKVPEQVFVLAHETAHSVCRDPQRMRSYAASGVVSVAGLGEAPYDGEQFNAALDYVRNAMLLETNVGMMNPAWLFDPDIIGTDLAERVYVQTYIDEQAEGGGGGPGQAPDMGNATFGQTPKAPRGAKPDEHAKGNGGRFDDTIPPTVNPASGKTDELSDAGHKEAVAAAATAAKGMGKLPASIEKMVEELLEPQVHWQDEIRMEMTGGLGGKREDYTRLNRRRLALNPIVFMPGTKRYGADTVVVGLDTSGSIYASPKALEAMWGEIGGILQDIRPKRVIVIQCDARVQRVSEAASLDELDYVRAEGAKGGGGTSFAPVFEYLAENDIKPDTLVYLTDLEGSFPEQEPNYPVVWASIVDHPAPFGKVVHIEV